MEMYQIFITNLRFIGDRPTSMSKKLYNEQQEDFHLFNLSLGKLSVSQDARKAMIM
jgi:hypothetical protein